MNIKFFKNIFNPLRIISIVFFILLFSLIAVFVYLMFGSLESNSEINFGVTFSQISAEELNIDWQRVYTNILDDLGVRKLRLIAYWPLIEGNKGEYLFDDLDWQINNAKAKGAEVILVIESKLPEWAKELNTDEKQESTLLFLKEVINHYNSKAIIKSWEIGEKEISLVRETDFSNKPIILTVNGEFDSWLKPAILADNLGISIIRNNWTQYWGYFSYPIRPIFYKKRADLTKFLTGLDKIIITELQAEPIGPKSIIDMSSTEWENSMSLNKFQDTINYVKRTGFDEVYFKGVEWWYYMKGEGNDSFWNVAKEIWAK